MPFLDGWKKYPLPDDYFPNYKAGSEGPQASDEWISKDSFSWPSI